MNRNQKVSLAVAILHHVWVVGGAAVLTLALFLILPVMQTISARKSNDLTTRQMNVHDFEEQEEIIEEEIPEEEPEPELPEEIMTVDLDTPEIEPPEPEPLDLRLDMPTPEVDPIQVFVRKPVPQPPPPQPKPAPPKPQPTPANEPEVVVPVHSPHPSMPASSAPHEPAPGLVRAVSWGAEAAGGAEASLRISCQPSPCQRKALRAVRSRTSQRPQPRVGRYRQESSYCGLDTLTVCVLY